MARAFKNTRKGITGHLEPGERQLIRRLFEDIIGMLEPEPSAAEDPLAALVGLDQYAVRPQDSALLRLLPDAVRGDDDAALEFRRLTERSLREQKLAALRASALLLDHSPLQLNEEQARLFARAVNDVRLVLADRLDIKTDEDAQALHDVDDWSQAEDLDTYLALVYNFLTWLQEALMQALLDGLGRTRESE
ncbi:DUF2017 domain-containing protein [Arthrobacter sp. I2-34]|uniref:DUF2017 domain-containing protein n=1 Tax=Arthrobacter hankyongi TaxID=2904801 RepID=A0ABS9LBF9_9MICC|nr:DUF2017 domain-containing protein [Arthrobacter hankyongi]MCG2624019.1 DUF2017 domain-containing protein [Arthrobacter hankyongi]